MKKLLILAILSCGIMIFINGCATLQDSRTNPSDSTISSEWEMTDFIHHSDEIINKQREVDDCYATNGKDSAICEKILDSWRESCARGEEKYCIGVAEIAIRAELKYESIEKIYNSLLESHYENSKIGKYLTPLKQNCDNGMADSCQTMGEFYGDMLYEETHRIASIRAAALEKALPYLQKSCDLGRAGSCLSIANIYKYDCRGTMEQVKIYRDKAREIASRDCKAGVKMACDFKETFLD